MFQSYSNLKQIINSANQSQICNGPTRWGSVASMWGMSWRNNGRTGYGLLSDIDRTKFNGGASISRETQTLTIGTFLSAIISNDELKKMCQSGNEILVVLIALLLSRLPKLHQAGHLQCVL